MKWRGRRTSSNIDDRRGASGGGGLKLGGVGLIAVALIAWALGLDPIAVLQQGGVGFGPPGQSDQAVGIDDTDKEFLSVVLADTEAVWGDLFTRMGRSYAPPTLVLFAGATGSACGTADSAAGPFYCPGDRQMYLDTQFFAVLERQLGARGDFARAYVVAHEVAHHVQNELGILPRINRQRAQGSAAEANALSVRIELQADCLSGVWARQAERRFGALEPGDIDEALTAAAQIGDDTLQRNAGRAVVPDSFTHGSSAQRVRWFRQGYDSGDPARCDTFAAARL